MKTQLNLAGLALTLAFSLQPSALLAQGGLTPPGAPGPTMKTLDQVEARIPISSAPFTITNAGSYYLTGNLRVLYAPPLFTSSNAIVIAASGVTLDLNGFTISSSAARATGCGILLWGSLEGITILNGHIRGGVTNDGGAYGGPGFAYGICHFVEEGEPQPLRSTRVAGVSVSGCLIDGISFWSGVTVVESCTVRTVGGHGIWASMVRGSVALDCGITAILGDQIIDSRGESNGGGNAVYANLAQNCIGYGTDGAGIRAATAVNCYGSSTGGEGVYAIVALNCYGSSTSGDGVSADTALNCRGSSTGGDGVSAITAQNCYGYSSGSGTGLRAADVAFACRGYSSSGVGLNAFIANSCRVAGGTASISYKYNMP